MAYALEFTLKILPKMSNANLRGHWRVKYLQTKAVKRLVWRACWHVKPPQPLSSAALSLTRVSSVEPDFDGLVSGFKAVVDGLVECGVIQCDKMSCIGQPIYKWEKCAPRKGHIKVKVEAA